VLVITSKSPYAVQALAELARRGDAAPVPIGDLARARDIPVQFLEGLFAALRRAGVLQSQRGVKGGYSFARPPAEVTVLEIVELLEGELGAEAAASGPIWMEATEAVRAVLAGTTIADIAEREARDSAAPMYYI
jgi:Rrf2 family transcriptional regulator, cysteine metabolism repressor